MEIIELPGLHGRRRKLHIAHKYLDPEGRRAEHGLKVGEQLEFTDEGAAGKSSTASRVRRGVRKLERG